MSDFFIEIKTQCQAEFNRSLTKTF